MVFDSHTIDPASSRSLAEFVCGLPCTRPSISSAVDHNAPSTRTDTSAIESTRSHRARRVIAPGSAAITATSRTPSISGSAQAGPSRTLSGRSTVRSIADRIAPAIGQRASATPVSPRAGSIQPHPEAASAGVNHPLWTMWRPGRARRIAVTRQGICRGHCTRNHDGRPRADPVRDDVDLPLLLRAADARAGADRRGHADACGTGRGTSAGSG